MIFFVVSFLGCLLLSIILKRVLSKSKLSLMKEKPMLLGLSVYFSVLVAALCATVYYKFNYSFMNSILLGALLILFLGIVDDVKRLSVTGKLLGQVAVACLTVLLGVRTTILYFPVWFNMLITIIWIVALVNAFNLLDIMDGLATGISFIISIFFLMTSLIAKAGLISIYFWILSGATLAAFLYNRSPARLYLGDSGSMLLGFLFACSALYISYAPDFSEGASLFVPILIVALPLYDLGFTIFMRKKKKIPIVKKSKDHFVFILESLGLSTKRILTLMYGVCICFGVSALLLKVIPSFLKIYLLAVVGCILILLTLAVSRRESQLVQKG